MSADQNATGPDQLRELVLAYYWGDDWAGPYPAWNSLTSEQQGAITSLYDLIAASHNNLIDRMEREIIGEDEVKTPIRTTKVYEQVGILKLNESIPFRNQLRQEQREKLKQLLNKHRSQ